FSDRRRSPLPPAACRAAGGGSQVVYAQNVDDSSQTWQPVKSRQTPLTPSAVVQSESVAQSMQRPCMLEHVRPPSTDVTQLHTSFVGSGPYCPQNGRLWQRLDRFGQESQLTPSHIRLLAQQVAADGQSQAFVGQTQSVPAHVPPLAAQVAPALAFLHLPCLQRAHKPSHGFFLLHFAAAAWSTQA